MKLKIVVLLAVLGLAASPAFAGSLTFPGDICSPNTDGSGAMTSCVNWTYISQQYGDNVDVHVTYKSVDFPGLSLRWWDTAYNDLIGVAFADGGDCFANGPCSYARIELAPQGGQTLILNGFDLGAWPSTVRGTHARVVELGTNNVLVDYGTPTIGNNNQHVHFAPNVSSTNGVAIEFWDTAYNVGIDNIDCNFCRDNSPSTSVPEPGSLVLLAAGLAGMTWVRRSAAR